MHGMKDAAQCLDVAWEDAMTSMGFSTRVSSFCPYHPTESGVSVLWTMCSTGRCEGSLIFLNWIVRCIKPPHGVRRDCIEYEADPRHAELVIHLAVRRAVCLRRVRKSKPGADHSTALSNTERACAIFRWTDPTCNSHRKVWRDGAPKRVARHMIGHGRVIQEFVGQVEEPCGSVVFTDSDHAVSLRTHKRTSSSKMFLRFPYAPQHHANGDFFELA